MHTNFRQGIITYPSSNGIQTFLKLDKNFITLLSTITDRIDITFAHGIANYLVTENTPVLNAWGPVLPNTDYWLYWDIDKTTGVRTFGLTTLTPIVSSTAPPIVNDQHWFDSVNHKMFVYQYEGWREVIRVFAAKVNNDNFFPLGSSIDYPFAGSQVGLNSIAIAGRIILDEKGLPIIQSNFTFLTTEDDLYVNGSNVNVIRLEADVVDVVADENIAKFQVVKFTDFGRVRLAAYSDLQTTLIGLTLSDILYHQSGKVCLSGVITNPAWKYTNIGGMLWADDTGLLTETNNHLTDPNGHLVSKLPVAQIITPSSILFGQGVGDVGITGDARQNVPLATDVIQGIAKLSVPAADPTNPIMVETNDPRLIPYVHPATHPATMITANTYNLLNALDVQGQLQQLADRSLGTLSDVNIPTPAPGNALVWNGTKWISSTYTTDEYLNDLLDVTITSPASNNRLVFGGTNWINASPSIAFTGDMTGSGTTNITTTLATVNSNIGTYGDSTHVAQFTVNAKGLITSVVNVPIASASGGGSLTSVDMSGGTTGLSYSGGPITTSGVFVLDGVLNISHGGTSATTANAAFNNLAPDQTSKSGQWLSTDGYNASWYPVTTGPVASAWAWGRNGNGCLGYGGSNDQISPVQVIGTDWKEISCGYQHTLGVKTDGTLWAWGDDSSGKLGLGDLIARSVPTQVGNLNTWASVGAGVRSSHAIKTDGTMWSWGANTYGQLGLGDTTPKSSPVQVGSLSDWKMVRSSVYSTAAIKTDGTLWTWGANTDGQLGLGDTTPRSSPVQVGSLTNWASVATERAGFIMSAIKTDGTLWTWGYNFRGQLAVGDTVDRSSPVQVGSLTDWKQSSFGAGTGHAIKVDGTLWGWGDNGQGTIGDGTIVSKSSPIQIGSLNTWAQVVGTSSFVTALRTDGTLWQWGYLGYPFNFYAQVSSPIQVGTSTTWTRLATSMIGTYSIATQLTPGDVIYPITNGGTGQGTEQTAIDALLPSQIGNAGKVLSTDGQHLIWVPKSSILP